MGNVVSGLSHLACGDLWRYVFNSMECHSKCYSDDGYGCQCDCLTNEVEVDDDDKCPFSCCLNNQDSTYTDDSTGDWSE